MAIFRNAASSRARIKISPTRRCYFFTPGITPRKIPSTYDLTIAVRKMFSKQLRNSHNVGNLITMLMI